MQLIKRISVAVVSELILSIVMLPAVATFDRYMITRNTDLILSPFLAAKIIFQSSRATLLWFLLVLLCLVGIISTMVCNMSVSVQSGTQLIAPGIRIPKPAGQGQHGTAHFLSKKKYSTVWSYITIRRDPIIQDLINQAKQELDQEGLD